MSSKGALRRLLGVAAAGALLGVVIGLVASRRSGADSSSAIAIGGSTVVGASTTLVLRGTLSSRTLALIKAGRAEADTMLLTVLRRTDCFTCEDLGRQLRELQHEAGRTLAVATPAADSLVVTKWLVRERIKLARVASIDLKDLFLDGSIVVTPAAMVIDHEGNVIRGVAHPQRAKNVRLRSFAAELGIRK